MSLFKIDGLNGVVDENGFYHGHTLLATVMEEKKKQYQEVFRFCKRVIGESETFDEIQKVFFEWFEQEYSATQIDLADNYLVRKSVKFFIDNAMAIKNLKVLGVYYESRSSGELFRLVCTTGNVIVGLNTSIQILN